MGGYLIFDIGKYHLWLWRFCNVAFLPTKDSKEEKGKSTKKKKNFTKIQIRYPASGNQR